MIRILIADDHSVVRRGLKEIIKEEPGLTVAAQATTAEETLDLLATKEFEVAIVDVSMPGKSGLDILNDIKKLRLKTRVLMLSMHPEEQFAVRALKMGAAGYLTKDASSEELVKAIRKIVSGGTYVSQQLAERLALDVGRKFRSIPHEKLSEREFEVLRLLALGKSVTQVAEALSLSVKTVSTYRSRILEKMNMKTTAQLIRYAVKSGLVE